MDSFLFLCQLGRNSMSKCGIRSRSDEGAADRKRLSERDFEPTRGYELGGDIATMGQRWLQPNEILLNSTLFSSLSPSVRSS